MKPSPTALEVLKRLRAAGYETYFCGGCVRDALLGKEPVDWDIATAAPPEEVAKLFPKTVAVGKAFGVMIVVAEGSQFEVATFRRDLEYQDGRRPSGVAFADAREDAQRRDFTINALFYDPLGERIIDFVGGLEDIQQRRLRAVGDPRQRFAEDHLRLLRAIRFAAVTGFTLDADTRQAISEMADLITSVSAERVGEELTRMLTSGQSREALALLAETGLLPHLLPEVAALRGVAQPPDFHPEGDVWQHTILMLAEMDQGLKENPTYPLPCQAQAAREDDISTAREIIAWATLLHDIGKPATYSVSDRIRFHEHDKLGAEMAAAVLDRLRRSAAVREAVRELVGGHMVAHFLSNVRVARQRKWAQNKLCPLQLELLRLDCLGSSRDLNSYHYAVEVWQAEQARPPEPQPLITGKDLLALGYKPGPLIGKILRAVEDARLEGNLTNREDAIEFIKQI